MSIAAPPQNTNPSPPASGTLAVADQLIDKRITEACKALWWAEVIRSALRLVMFAIGAVLVWVVVDQWIYSPGIVVRLVVFTAFTVSLVWYLWRRMLPLLGSKIRPEYAARSLERDLPELRQSLTSYVTLRGDRDATGLRSRVVRSMGALTAGRLRSYDELPFEATGTFRWWVATAIALAVLVTYAAVSPKNTLQSAARLAAPLASIDPARRVSIREVEPGNVEAIAGRTLEVSAVIDGMRDDEEAYCRWDLPAGRQEIALQQDENQRKYSGEVWLPHSASGSVKYVIAAGDAVAGPFTFKVQDVPVVALQSVRHEPPDYTGHAPHTSSTGAITALDGTRVKILATTNRSVAKARIEFNPRELGDRIRATAGAADMEIDPEGTSLSVSFPLRSARGRSAAVELESYRIQVWDDAGQSNPDPIIYPIRVIADLPPEVSITMPMKSPQEVPINAQLPIEVHASDPDFGLKHLGLEIRTGIDMIAEPILWSDPNGAKGNRVAEYRFRPTEHGLRIGDTLKVVAVAIDNREIEYDPSVEPNVVRTDPIELKITASDSLPREGDPNAGGLSAPDDRPASDHSSQNQESSNDPSGDQGEQQSGGGGSGEGGESQSGSGDSGEGQSGQGKSGADNSGEGQTGEGKSGESNSGENQSEQGESGEGQTGEPTSGEGMNSEGQSGAGKSGRAQPGQQQTGEELSGKEQAGEGQNGEAEAGDGQSGEAQPSGEGQSSETPSTTGDNAAAPGNETGSSEGQSPAANESPKHDGETFERIRDYLEQKREEQQQSGSGSRSSKENSGTSSQRDSNSENASKDNSGNENTTEPRGGDQPTQPDGSGSSGDEPQSDTGDREPGDSGDMSDQQPGGGATRNGENTPGTGSDSGGEQSQSNTNQDGEGASKPSDPGANSKQSPAEGDSGEGQSGEKPSDQGKPQNNAREQGSEQGDASDPGSEGTGNREQGSSDDNGGTSDDPGNSESPTQNDQSGEGQSGRQPNGDQPNRDQPSSEGQSESQPGQQQGRTGENDSGENSSTPSGDPNQNSSRPPSASNPGTGIGSDGVGEAGESPVPPDPVNVDYAKKATDLVLDYLDETRDAPDRQLLDELNWTEEDLKRFADRWQNVRDASQASEVDPATNRDVAEALKSLGLRPKTESSDPVRDSADSLRSIRDSGNRKPPPAAFRDAFDAFRRAVGRQ